jgi:hypothetical protein
MWALIGALGTLSLVGIASIGLFVAPVVALLAWMQVQQGGTEQVGWSALGAALFLIGLGIASLPYQACGSSDTSTTSVSKVGESASYECGGLHPAVLFGLGAVLLIGALASALRRR